jgi:N-acetylneuraminic acid mutarotase
MRAPDGVLFRVADAPSRVIEEPPPPPPPPAPPTDRDTKPTDGGKGDEKKDGGSTPGSDWLGGSLNRIGKLAEQATATTAAVATLGAMYFPQEEAKRWAGAVVLLLLGLMGGLLLYRRRRSTRVSRGLHEMVRSERWPKIAAGLAAAMLLLVGFQVAATYGFTPVPGDNDPTYHVGSWTQEADLQVSRNEVAGAVLWDKIYVAGTDSSGRATGALGEYDPRAQTWQEIPPPQEGLQIRFAGMAAAKGKLYLVGGFGPDGRGIDTVWTFDPLERRWDAAAPLSQGRGSMVVVAANEKIYAMGGRSQLLGGDDVGTAEVFDPDSNSWNRLPNMPTPRNHVAGAVANGKIYAIGGRRGSFSDKEAEHLAVVEVYDPATRSWKRGPDMTAARSGIAAATVGSRIYVFGGEGPTFDTTGEPKIGIVNVNESYAAADDAWMIHAELPTSRHGYAAVARGEKIYVMGGGLAAGGGVSRVNEVFDPRGG